MSSAPNHDHSSGRPQVTNSPGTSATVPPDLAQMTMDTSQVVDFLRNIPGVFAKNWKLQSEGSSGDGDAAQILSNLAQSSAFQLAHSNGHHISAHQLPQHQYQHSHPMNDPGPSSHPRGPPNLGQMPQNMGVGTPRTPPMAAARTPGSDESPADADGKSNEAHGSPTNSAGGSRTRSGRAANMSNDEWARQRKDNHKEVERRRRGNINEGINELGRIVPNGSGEKAKGAILSRAVQYIHHLKENEARNIEKWTLEKLLMDQAMGDLQGQLEEMRRLWEEERDAKLRLEKELEALRNPSSADRREKSPAGNDGNRQQDQTDKGVKRKRVD